MPYNASPRPWATPRPMNNPPAWPYQYRQRCSRQRRQSRRPRGDATAVVGSGIITPCNNFSDTVRCGWFFPSPDGNRWEPDNISHDLRAANREAALPWRCLDFRHTFGSQLAMKGESLYKIATLLGN